MRFIVNWSTGFRRLMVLLQMQNFVHRSRRHRRPVGGAI